MVEQGTYSDAGGFNLSLVSFTTGGANSFTYQNSNSDTYSKGNTSGSDVLSAASCYSSRCQALAFSVILLLNQAPFFRTTGNSHSDSNRMSVLRPCVHFVR